MIQNFFTYVCQGWQSDNATWLNVFVSLVTIGVACYLFFFILFGWMILIY